MSCLGLLSVLLCVACNERHESKGMTPLVEVNGNSLYLEDLRAMLPSNLQKKDSIAFSEHYIRNWIEDVLLLEKAKNNIPDNDAIEKMVENYRNALVLHAYQQELVHQKLSAELSEKEVMDYYLKNKTLFRLDASQVKGLFIKVPLTAPKISSVRTWYRQDSHEALEHLEKYSLQNAVRYDFFYDKWRPTSEVAELLPLKILDEDTYFSKNRNVEVKDSAFYYFLHVKDYLAKGEEEPYESAHSKAKEFLLNQKRADYIKQLKDELYRKAMKRNEIKYN